jgi:hypothetical protein
MITSVSKLAAFIDDFYFIRLFGDDAKKFEVLFAYIPVPMGNLSQDEDHIPGMLKGHPSLPFHPDKP